MSTIEKKSVSVGKYADKKLVDRFISRYKQERWAQNSERIGREDALSGWYTLEELEEFIQNVKMQGGDGIRLYFGVFPEGYQNNKEIAGRQTAVFVGTRSSDGSYASSKDLFIRDGKENKVLAYLGGQPCPSYCGPVPPGGQSLGLTMIDKGDNGISVI